MSNEPIIRPVLAKKRNNWTVTLEEDWGDSVQYLSKTSSRLDKNVKWVEEELKKWPGVRRMAWDQWYFDDRRQAEKFITFYHLAWDQLK